jgi:predicted amidohydrolase
MTAKNDLQRNLRGAEALIAKAAARGAKLVALPENLSFMGPEADKLATAEDFALGAVGSGCGPVLRWAAHTAKQHAVWLLLGGVTERSPLSEKVFNTALLIDDQGTVVSKYRKIHLFDVDLADGTRHQESAVVCPGEQVVVCDSPVGKLGLSICYDVRFAELYRQLVTLGAQVLAVPAAFTVTTGRDHWHVLLRARAIEAQCYVIAPAQWGMHSASRSTYGHAMIVDPWGTIVAECPDGEGIAIAEIDLGRLEQIRTQLPALKHRRL